MIVEDRSKLAGSMVLLPRLAKHIMRRSTEEVVGMPFRLFIALSYLHDHDGVRQQQLADALCMDAGNIVLLLNELEDVGHISRIRDPADRRRHKVAITNAGREAVERAKHSQEQIEDDILEALDADERNTLWRLLTRAVRRVDEDQPAK
jgi:DNA-binding MarR family transcriptional regulator